MADTNSCDRGITTTITIRCKSPALNHQLGTLVESLDAHDTGFLLIESAQSQSGANASAPNLQLGTVESTDAHDTGFAVSAFVVVLVDPDKF